MQGADKLAPFLNGIDASRQDDPHLTALGHSYGSTTTGYALQQDTGVDDAVFFGSPGLGTRDVGNLFIPEEHAYNIEGRSDPVADMGQFGPDPSGMPGMNQLSAREETGPDDRVRLAQLLPRSQQHEPVQHGRRPYRPARQCHPRPVRSRMRNLTLSTLLSCAIALTACGSDDNAMTQQFTELLTRPALEEVLEQYKQMRQEIADELTTAFGLLEWTVNESTGGGSLCGQEFIDLGVDARNERPPLLSTTTSIPDAQWDQAVQIAEKIARKNGFGAPQHVVDRTGQHTVDFRDKWGGLLGMDSGVNAVLSVDTGCHLTEEAHRRGTPTPLPEHNR